jgi:hypothetical protein
MIIDPQLLEKFYYWLNAQSYRTQSWEERGIRENAPDEAKKAYAQFLEIEKDMREHGKK